MELKPCHEVAIPGRVTVRVALAASASCRRRSWRFYNRSTSEMRVQAFLPLAPSPAPSAVRLMTADMREVDSVIQRRLASDVAMINQIAHYIISAGGKRIRPMLVLLFSSALGFRPRAVRTGGHCRVRSHSDAPAR